MPILQCKRGQAASGYNSRGRLSLESLEYSFFRLYYAYSIPCPKPNYHIAHHALYTFIAYHRRFIVVYLNGLCG